MFIILIGLFHDFIIVINEILIIVINSLLMNISLKMAETNQGSRIRNLIMSNKRLLNS